MSGNTRGPTRDRNGLLAALSPIEYDRLGPCLQEVHLRPKQLLGIPDEPITLVYFPRSAIVSLLVRMQDGAAVEGATVGNEGLIGLDAVLGNGFTCGESVVHVPGTAVAIDARTFRDVFRSSAPLRNIVLQYTLALMQQICRTAGCNGRHSVRQRLVRLLLTVQDTLDVQTLPLTHELLALMLGVRRASVSQAASGLQKDRLIEYHRGSITICDSDGLSRSACSDYALIRSAYAPLRHPVWN